ncbi:MAG: hypothetical protein IJ192_11055 [Clostridia bacterium]|nr:hypothetical protein [Clostridia bacterium]
MSNGRTYTTKYGANTSNFKQGMNEMVKELENYNKALVDNQYRQKDCNKVITEAQKEIKQIKKDIKENGDVNGEKAKEMAIIFFSPSNQARTATCCSQKYSYTTAKTTKRH